MLHPCYRICMLGVLHHLAFRATVSYHRFGTATVNVEKILNDPTVSHWLKQAIRDLNNRDCVDAVSDATLLLQVATERMNRALGRI